MKINKFFLTFCLYIGFIILGFLSIITAFNTCYVSLDHNTYHYFLGDSIIKNIVIAVIAVVLTFIVKLIFKDKIIEINRNDKLFRRILFVLLVVILAESLVFVYSSKVVAISDSFWIQEAVSQFKHGNYSSFVSGGYMERWTNQAGFFLISYLFSFVFGEFNFIAFQTINCICVTMSYYFITKIIKCMGYSNFVSLTTVFIGIIFFPFIMYTTFVYGNIIGLMFSVVGILNAIRYTKTNSNKYLVYSVLSSAFATIIKQNYFINAVAIVIMIVFSKLHIKKKTIYIFSLVSFILLMNFIPVKFIRIKTALPFNQGSPSTAFVAMGLQEGDRAPGWFNGYNINVYANNNYQTSLASKESIAEIKNRIQYFNDHKGYALNFFLQKISSEWSEPSFESLTINQNMLNWTMVKNPSVERIYRNEFYLSVIDYLNTLQFLIYFGTLLFVIVLLANEEKDINQMIFLIIFIGGFIFHVFWEAKAQYTITYFVLLIPLAVQGYNLLAASIIKKQLSNNKKALIIPLTILICMIMVFVVMNKKYMLISLTSDGAAYYDYVGESYQNELNSK